MPNGKLPYTDVGFMHWSRNFATRLNTVWAECNVSESDAIAYAALDAAYAAALKPVIDPGTRSQSLVAAKNTARSAAMDEARRLVAIVARSQASDALKIELGVPIRRARATLIGAPTSSPRVALLEQAGRALQLRLFSRETIRQGMPDGVAGARIYYAIGERPGDSLSDWQLETTTTRTHVDVMLDAALPPGTRVWWCACWFNPRTQPGPLSAPIETYVQFGGAMHHNTISHAA